MKADVALDVINASSGRSNASMNLFPERVLTRAFPRTFRLALLDKDVGIAAGQLRGQRVDLGAQGRVLLEKRLDLRRTLLDLGLEQDAGPEHGGFRRPQL